MSSFPMPLSLTFPGLHGSNTWYGGRFRQRWMMFPNPRLLTPMFMTSASMRLAVPAGGAFR